jgi:hypothetical protein
VNNYFSRLTGKIFRCRALDEEAIYVLKLNTQRRWVGCTGYLRSNQPSFNSLICLVILCIRIRVIVKCTASYRTHFLSFYRHQLCHAYSFGVYHQFSTTQRKVNDNLADEQFTKWTAENVLSPKDAQAIVDIAKTVGGSTVSFFAAVRSKTSRFVLQVLVL